MPTRSGSLIDRGQAASIVRTCDSLVWKPLDEAIGLLDGLLKTGRRLRGPPHGVLQDQRDRLRALRCYFRTLRNIAGWIGGVHGYMASSTPERTSGHAFRSAGDDRR